MHIAYRIKHLVKGPPPVAWLHRLGVMSRPEDRRSLISNYRRVLLRATFVLGCRRVRLELDESPSAEEALALGMQESRLEYATSRLNQNGVVVLQDREVQLSRHGIEMNGEYMRAEDLEEEQRRYMLTEGEQRLASCWRAGSLKRAVASASAGTGAAPSAGEAAVPGAGEAASAGAGEAALAGSRSRSRSPIQFHCCSS